jgi:hypothetical protein
MGLGLFSQQLISIRIDEIEVAAPGNVPRAVEVAANGTLPLEGGDSQGELTYLSMTGVCPLLTSEKDSKAFLCRHSLLSIWPYYLLASKI